jgi:tetratricopeptide (TPR) repeat protein
MLSLAESLNDPVLIAAHTLLLGAVSHIRGNWERARTYLLRCDELFATAGPSFVAVSMVAARAPCLIWEGQWEEARGYLESILELSRSMHARPSEHHALFRLAELELLEGRPHAAVTRLEPLATSALEWSYAVPLLSTLARAYLEVDDLPRAEPLAERAVAEAHRLGTWVTGIDAVRVQGMVAARKGNYDGATKSFEEGIQRARAMPFPYAQAQLLHAYGLLEWQQGYHAAAGAKLAEARAIFERLGATTDIQRLRRAIAET